MNRKIAAFTIVALTLLTQFLPEAAVAAENKPAVAAEDKPAASGRPLPTLAPMLDHVMPSVVNISVVGEIDTPLNPYANIPKGQRNKVPGAGKNPPANNSAEDGDDDEGNLPTGTTKKFMSVGSGVIVNAEQGYILTNAHVISGAKTVTITLNDGRQFKARLIGADTVSDIAVVQINANHLTALPMANSNKLQVGDYVVAIGNPFGLNQTVTSGIVSALKRSSLGIEGLENFIQTDASINMGNSGGALVDLNGKLVGINTAILAPDGGNIGIGFAIPANMAKSVMLQLIKYGSVHRGLMGIMIQNLSPDLAEAMSLKLQKGALVTQVTPDSPADKAGIKAGDIVVNVNGADINDSSQVTNIVGLSRVGSELVLKVLRNGNILSLNVVTASPKQYLQDSKAKNPLLFGLNFKDFDQMTAIHGLVQGVQITGIAETSPAFNSTPVGLRPGDVIVSANMQSVHNTKELVAIAQQNKHLLLNIYRGSGAMFVVVN